MDIVHNNVLIILLISRNAVCFSKRKKALPHPKKTNCSLGIDNFFLVLPLEDIYVLTSFVMSVPHHMQSTRIQLYQNTMLIVLVVTDSFLCVPL